MTTETTLCEQPELDNSIDEFGYRTVEGMMTAGEAADHLVFHAKNLAAAIKRKDNCCYENRQIGINALFKLLDQYVAQDRADKGMTGGR